MTPLELDSDIVAGRSQRASSSASMESQTTDDDDEAAYADALSPMEQMAALQPEPEPTARDSTASSARGSSASARGSFASARGSFASAREEEDEEEEGQEQGQEQEQGEEHRLASGQKDHVATERNRMTAPIQIDRPRAFSVLEPQLEPEPEVDPHTPPNGTNAWLCRPVGEAPVVEAVPIVGCYSSGEELSPSQQGGYSVSPTSMSWMADIELNALKPRCARDHCQLSLLLWVRLVCTATEVLYLKVAVC